MIPEPITIGGRSGTVMYLNADWHPVPPEQATMAKVLFDDGSVSFFTTSEETQKREYVRDEKGQFAETGKQLQGDEADEAETARTFFHGTTNARLDAILERGLLTAHAGEVWPNMSQRDSVYITADEEDAINWANGAIENEKRALYGQAGAKIPDLAILTIRIPDDQAARLTRDAHFADVPGNPARQFKGNIPPEWIVGAKIGVVSDEDVWTSDYKWTKVRVKKAAEGRIVYVVIVLQPVAPAGIGGITRKFDEAKHPRHPEGSSEGGQFAETGRSGEATSDPVLAVQAKAGIAAVEELLPEAVKTADYSQEGTEIEDWDDIDSEGQNEAYYKFLESYEEDLDTSSLAADVKEELKKENQKVLDEAVEDLERRLSHETFIDEFGKQRALAIGEGATPPASVEEQFQLKKTLDMETLDYGYGDDEDGTVELDWDKLRFTTGQELTAEEKELVKQQWDSAYEKAFEDALQAEYESSSYQERESELRDEASREAWDNLSDSEKLQIYNDEVSHARFGHTRRVKGGEPDQWMTGVETGTHSNQDYVRTHAIALKLAELRTEQLREERGLLKGVPFGHLPQDTPRYTITKSKLYTPENPSYIIKDAETDDVIGASNTLEQATINAEEWARQQASKTPVSTEKLIRDVWEQWKVSSNAGLSLSMQLASAIELGGHHRLTPKEVEDAIELARPYGGIATLQAYVRAQWETTQFVMDKAGEDKISVYRGLMLPGEKVEATTKTYADKLGRPIAPPANIKTGDDPNTKEPYVSFDFNGEHFVVQKERARPKSITDLGPQTWHEVAGGTKEEVYQKWKEDAQGAFAADVAAGKVTPERAEELTKKLFDKLGDESRFELLKTYASTGRVFLKVPPPRPYESDEEAVSRRLKKYEEDQQVHREDPQILTKLPDLILQRAGAQSTTGTRQVANDWGGVGNLPETPTRVVLRLEVPSTSILSLPVYGQNSQEEHETVIMGTKDKWLWDAWKNKAPSFSLPISESARKAETTPLVIDLQAEDRGKPHWMSGVDWSTVEKREYAREPAGTEHGGEFASTAVILQGVDSKANAEAQITEFRRVRKFLSGEEPDLAKERAAEEELRALPLVHGTTVAGAMGAIEKGLLSHLDMEDQTKALLADIDDLKDSITNIVGEDADWDSILFWTDDDIAQLRLDRSDAKALLEYVQELQDIEKVVTGTTHKQDEAVGLDEFVFMTHGEKHQDYGNVAVIVDNEVLQDGWATEKDIVSIPGIDAGDEYSEAGIDTYQHTIVKGDDYYKVAAAKAGSPEALLHRSREQLFEVKAPRVPKRAIKGFLVADDFDAAQRLADKLAAKGLKDKVLYVEDPGYDSERKHFVQDQLKTLQATDMWDDEAVIRFREQHEGVYIL